MTTDTRGHRLRRLADLGDTHLGRTITLTDGPTGTLTGVIPIGDRIQLALIVGGSRIWTDALPADTHVEIHQRTPP